MSRHYGDDMGHDEADDLLSAFAHGGLSIALATEVGGDNRAVSERAQAILSEWYGEPYNVPDTNELLDLMADYDLAVTISDSE